jgi:hypothetical protein
MKKLQLLTVFLVGFLLSAGQLFPQNNLSGTYYYQGNVQVPLPNIHVELFDMDNTLIASTITGDDGSYLIEDIPFGDYYIASSTNMASGGVTLVDAYKVMFYLIGWYDLTDMEFEIADTDNDSDVTWDDLDEIMMFIIFGTPFSGGDWEFEDVTVNFAARTIGDSVNPWGSSSGDVEGAWEPSGRDIALMPSRYYHPEQVNTTTAAYVIGTGFNGDLNGFELNLGFAADNIEIVRISGPDENFTYSIDSERGVVKLAWLNKNMGTSTVNGKQLFAIEVKNLGNKDGIAAEELLYLLPGGVLIDSESNILKDTEINLPLLENKQLIVEVGVYPNPVVNRLNFNVSSNKQSQACLSVYDLSGKLVHYVDGVAIHEGEQAVTVDVTNLLPGNYVYSFDLKEDNESVMGRFVKSK